MDPVMTVIDLSKAMRVDPATIRELGRRRDDPLPIRLLPGKKNGQFVLTDELVEWIKRNAGLISDSRPHGR